MKTSSKQKKRYTSKPLGVLGIVILLGGVVMGIIVFTQFMKTTRIHHTETGDDLKFVATSDENTFTFLQGNPLDASVIMTSSEFFSVMQPLLVPDVTQADTEQLSFRYTPNESTIVPVSLNQFTVIGSHVPIEVKFRQGTGAVVSNYVQFYTYYNWSVVWYGVIAGIIFIVGGAIFWRFYPDD